MDAYLIKLWAEHEVGRATTPYRECGASIFANNTVPCLKNINHAIEYLNSLSQDELEFRIAMWHWEDKAEAKYDELINDSSKLLSRSIDPREWARLEIGNIDQLLEKGVDNLMTPCEYFHAPSEIPSLYTRLLVGNWTNFIFFEELRTAYQSGFEASDASLLRWQWEGELADEERKQLLIAMRDNWEYLPNSEKVRRATALPIYKGQDQQRDQLQEFLVNVLSVLYEPKDEENLYKRNEAIPSDEDGLYNKNWHLAKAIQALIWYKNYLQGVYKNGVDFSEENEYLPDDEDSGEGSTPKNNSVKILNRVNDGYLAMMTCYELYQSMNGRPPNWDELIRYMSNNPVSGFCVTAKLKGNKVHELTIEGVDKPIDRAAFRKRFERYFKKKENRQDNY
jgi:hypothetical protein